MIEGIYYSSLVENGVLGMKRVAVFTAKIYSEMVKETQYGLIQAAKRNKIKLIFFSGFSDNYGTSEEARFTEYDDGDFAVYYLPDVNEYDGLITMDTYLPDHYLQPINDMKKAAKCPVVTLGQEDPNTYCIVNDQEKSLEILIEHLIEEHGCTELVHVAGRLELSFAAIRKDVFINTLKKHGLKCEERNIVQGNLWYNCGEEVVEQIIKDYSKDSDRLMPDAIVCANDYSAIGVFEALTKRGYSIPEDVIITGYDNIPQAMFMDPTLTTSEQPFEQVGKEGINMLVKHWKGLKPPHMVAVPGVLKRNQSCGCEPKHVYKKDVLKEEYSKTIDRLGNLSQANTYLILSVLSAKTNEEFWNNMEDNFFNETGFKDAVLCLMKDWDTYKTVNSPEDIKNETFEVMCGSYKGKPIKRGILPQGQLLPDVMNNDPEPYYIVPIHNFQYFMGYFIINPDLENLKQANMKAWFLNISTLLESLHIKQELNKTVDKLQNLYCTDVLTGLYNRRGYDMFFNDYYKECQENHIGLAVFVIDMDGMKGINDNYGHDEGDYCLNTIGYSLKAAAKHGEICIRSGGDEFVVLAKNYDEKKIEKFKKDLRSEIDKKRKNDGKSYSIEVSIGCYMEIPAEPKSSSDEIDINAASEKYLRYADREMYIEKKERKKGEGVR